MLQNSCDTKVTDLDGSILVHEDVLGLQISVQNFPVMDMLDSECHLNEPIKDLVFAITNFAYLLLVGNLCVKVTAISIVHDNAQTSLVHKALFVSNNIRMTHRFQHVHFIDGVFSLLAVHL